MINSSDIHKGTILVVDDLAVNVQLLKQMLGEAGYSDITTTMDPLAVYDLHRQNRYDLIVLDVEMPGMDGFQVLEGLKELASGDYPPVLVITAHPDHKLHALKAGAKDFISKPFELAEVLARVYNMMEVRLLHKELHNYNEMLDKRVRSRTADLQDSYLETILTMTRAAEHKEENTGAHVQRISSYCRNLAMALGAEEDFIDKVFFASPMHDIGKIGIPDHILLKPGVFTPDEWEVMKEHTVVGGQILGNSKSPYLVMGAEIALNHHERWDGGGYPNGKCGEEIPLAARIMTICDIYDALRSKRSYKPPYDHQKSMRIITQGDGRTQPEHFDPVVHAAFIQHQQAFCDIFEMFIG